MLFSRLGSSLPTLPSAFLPARLASLHMHTSAPQATSWGGGKLKTHSGTAKRFKPVGMRRGPPSPRIVVTAYGAELQMARGKAMGPMFKRGQSGKQHLNSKMPHGQEARLRGTKVHRSGHTIRTLNRLIGSHF